MTCDLQLLLTESSKTHFLPPKTPYWRVTLELIFDLGYGAMRDIILESFCERWAGWECFHSAVSLQDFLISTTFRYLRIFCCIQLKKPKTLSENVLGLHIMRSWHFALVPSLVPLVHTPIQAFSMVKFWIYWTTQLSASLLQRAKQHWSDLLWMRSR